MQEIWTQQRPWPAPRQAEEQSRHTCRHKDGGCCLQQPWALHNRLCYCAGCEACAQQRMGSDQAPPQASRALFLASASLAGSPFAMQFKPPNRSTTQPPIPVFENTDQTRPSTWVCWQGCARAFMCACMNRGCSACLQWCVRAPLVQVGSHLQCPSNLAGFLRCFSNGRRELAHVLRTHTRTQSQCIVC